MLAIHPSRLPIFSRLAGGLASSRFPIRDPGRGSTAAFPHCRLVNVARPAGPPLPGNAILAGPPHWSPGPAMPSSDLSRVHQPASQLFPRCSGDQAAGFRLSAEQIASFHEHGYLSGLDVLDAGQVEVLRTELEEFFKPGHEGQEYWYEYHTNESDDPGQVLFHALGAWRLRPGFHDLLWNPALTIPASQLLEGSVRFWHDQLFCKPPRQGGGVAWHQDYSYWTRTRPMQHLTIWIGLDDAGVDNGCLQYIPGSHRWDLLPITGLAGDMDAIRKVLAPEQWEALQSPVPIELRAGQATLHHPLMVHGSTGNHSDRPRRAAVVNLVRDGVCAWTDEPLLTGVDPIPAGQPLQGQFFPLLWETHEAGTR